MLIDTCIRRCLSQVRRACPLNGSIQWIDRLSTSFRPGPEGGRDGHLRRDGNITLVADETERLPGVHVHVEKTMRHVVLVDHDFPVVADK